MFINTRSASDAFDISLSVASLKDILSNRAVELPTYDFKTHSRLVHVFLVWVFIHVRAGVVPGFMD